MSSWISRLCASAALVASLLLVVGCGGGSTPATASVTRAQFIRQANAICDRLYKQQAQEMQAYRKGHGFKTVPTLKEQEQVNTAVVMDVERQKIRELGELPVPSGDGSTVRTFLDAMERGVRESEDAPSALASPTPPEPFEDARKLTGAYGIGLCGQA
jgi:hypothetical protein